MKKLKYLELFENFQNKDVILIIDGGSFTETVEEFLEDDYWKPCFSEKDFQAVIDMEIESELTINCEANNNPIHIHKTTKKVDYSQMSDDELIEIRDPNINKGGIPLAAVQEYQKRFPIEEDPEIYGEYKPGH